MNFGGRYSSLDHGYLHQKYRTAYLFLFLSSLLLVLRSCLWDGCFHALPVQIYQAWLLLLYIGLALRENILRVNGSDIRPWWIYHHHFVMAMALISLTWEIERQPDCAQKQARRMDVVWGETARLKGQLWILLPILFVLKAFEAYVGVLLLKTAFVTRRLWEWLQKLLYVIRMLAKLKKPFIATVNMMTAAAQCYNATLTVLTGLSAPFNNLAIIYKQQALGKQVVSEQGGPSAELTPPFPSRLVIEDEIKSFCEVMKAFEVPTPVVIPGYGGKRKSELGNLDTHNYGRGKRAREVCLLYLGVIL
ncbi:unnamed protein product [Lactuca virosa]|uniref:Uncharacterized protein n=1 Tax=Lactuca virosa TaxID=75947 RepID=A0AAU9PJS4_9ASTR|nr:unnamed protein product [Lactuca virosa]